jgi:hypothetical protein
VVFIPPRNLAEQEARSRKGYGTGRGTHDRKKVGGSARDPKSLSSLTIEQADPWRIPLDLLTELGGGSARLVCNTLILKAPKRAQSE